MGNNPVRSRAVWFAVLIICSSVVMLFQVVFSQVNSSEFSELMLRQRRNSISKMVQLSYNTIRPVIDRVKTGEIDSNQARMMIRDIVRNMTYEDEFGANYMFMSTYDGIMLVQPFEQEKEGTNQWDLMDANNKYIIQELVKAAREKPQGSFVIYSYYPPGKSKAEEKLSYVMGIPEIGAYIGTGMYVESSYYELEKILKHQRYGYLTLALFILITMMLYFRVLRKGNNMLINEIGIRQKAEEDLKDRYLELRNTKEELQQKHDELTAIHEELIATEEELRAQYEELQKSQEEFRVLAERYMLVSEGSMDVIWDWDVISDKIYISGRLKEILGYSKDELNIDKHEDLYVIMHPEDKERERRSYHRHIDDREEYYSSEVRLRARDGVYKWFHMRLKSIYDSNGEVIRNAGSITDISERKRHEEEVRNLAYNDYLTGLPNRVFAFNELEGRLSRYQPGTTGGAVFFIDIDNFKIINDTFGHSYGDKVLIEVSDRLKSLSDGQLTIARIGGDEFIIIQYSCRNEEDAGELAQKVLQLFKVPVCIEDNKFNIACSIGIALYPMYGSTKEEVLKNADLAMYRAKNTGRNRYILYDNNIGPDMLENGL